MHANNNNFHEILNTDFLKKLRYKKIEKGIQSLDKYTKAENKI